MANKHGDFIWYELMTTDADGAARFYGQVLGWTFKSPDITGIDYRLFGTAESDVGGVMTSPEGGGMPPVWLGYVGVDDVDKMVESVTDGGGAVHLPPTDIPGVGRFAFVADPQGALFYVMKGAVEGGESQSFSYDKPRPGHCAWNELSTTDPAAALHFYGQRFGWVKDGDMDMGPMGKYEFLRHTGHSDGTVMGAGMIGAVMPKMPEMPTPAWTYYFRVPDIDAAATAIAAGGGQVVMGPMEIPGGDYSMNAVDPQGASFALVGSRKG
jgi:uncharacterized protein